MENGGIRTFTEQIRNILFDEQAEKSLIIVVVVEVDKQRLLCDKATQFGQLQYTLVGLDSIPRTQCMYHKS